jgi:hypothetical protein
MSVNRLLREVSINLQRGEIWGEDGIPIDLGDTIDLGQIRTFTNVNGQLKGDITAFHPVHGFEFLEIKNNDIHTFKPKDKGRGWAELTHEQKSYFLTHGVRGDAPDWVRKAEKTEGGGVVAD